jgi:IclR family acetate operon transcriptional repressor
MTSEAPGDDAKGLGSVRSIERAVEVLQAFTLERPSMTVAEIVQFVPLSRPTLYRLLRTLEGKGMVRSYGDPARYELGGAIARIAHVWLSRLDPARLAAPFLARLWDETNETVAFCLPQGDMRVCVAEHPGRQPLSYARGVGSVDSIASTASGRAMLAFLPAAEIEGILRNRSDAPLVRAALEEVRRTGIAVSGGALAGIRGVAVPVFDRDGKVVASVAVTGPEVRLIGERFEAVAQGARRTAAEISAALGNLAAPVVAAGLPARRRGRPRKHA